MPRDPYADVASPVSTAQADPYADIASPVAEPAPADEFQPTPYGFKVKPIQLGKVQTVQREDGAAYFGPEQGNTGKPGWFDAQGNRVGDAPGKGVGMADAMINRGEANRRLVYQSPGMAILKAIGDTGIGGPSQIPGVPSVAGVGKGLSDSVLAPAQFAAHVGGSNVMDPVVDAAQGFYTDNFDRNLTGEMVGQAAPFLATMGGSAAAQAPKVLTAAERVRAALATIGKATATGAVAAPALTPETNVQGEGDFWGRKTEKAILGGAFGLAGSTAAVTLPWLAGKGADLLAGTGLGNRLGIPTMVKPKFAGAPGLADDLAGKGIRTTAGDVTGDAAIRSTEDAMARRNPKMMDFRLAQNQEASAYADTVVSDLKSAVKSEGWRSLDDLRAAVESGGKRSGQAEALLNAIENSGDDMRQIAHKSGNLNLLVEKLAADAKFDKATAIARLYGDVKPTDLVGSLKANISAIKGNRANDQSLVPYLEGILEDVQAGKNLGFGDLRNTRTILNNKIKGLTAPGAVVQDVSAARTALQNVTKAIEGDLDRFARGHSSGLRNAWEDAITHYKEKVVPYKAKDMASVLADDDPMKLVSMFSGKNPYEQKRMLALLDPKGQAALRASLIEDAVLAGEKTQRGVTGPTFSAAQVANKLEKLEKSGTMDVVFPGGEDRWAAKGLAKVLRTVDRSDTVAFNPPTGQVLDRIGALKSGRTLMDVAHGAAEWLTKDNLLNLYTNPKGRVLLQRASGMKPGSPAITKLIEQDIPKFLAIQTPKNVQPFTPSRLPAAADTSNPDTVAQQ